MSLMTAQVQSADASKEEALIEALVGGTNGFVEQRRMLTPSPPDAPRTSVSPILLELLTTDERPLSNVTLSFSRVFKAKSPIPK
jgi:hypothetical protein